MPIHECRESAWGKARALDDSECHVVVVRLSRAQRDRGAVKQIRPSFERPPLVEQAIVIVFEPLRGFSIVDYGLFWQEIRSEFPLAESTDPTPEQTEVFDEIRNSESRLQLFQTLPLPRAMFRDEAGGELVQLQPDRFGFNWSKVGDKHYPRSEHVMARFEELFAKFRSYVEARNIGPVKIKQCELTNLNIIPVRDFGSGYEDMTRALNVDPLDLGIPFLQAETYIRARQHRILDDGNAPVGRLHTEITPVISTQDREKAFRLEITARSRPNITTLEEMRSFFDLGRNSINAAFCATVTDQMRKHWGEHDA